jgi:alpha-1,6-mannosyltransferase
VNGERRYFWLSAIVAGIVTAHTLNEQWGGDFWEHAAVVRELSQRPLMPQHPLFAVSAPHPFFSPYLLGVAIIARTLGLDAPAALGAAGLVNLIAFLIVFRAFATHLVGAAGAFYALLFTLVLWGADAFRYSGFLHLNALGFVVAYPSMFATWLTLLGWYALLGFLHGSHWTWAVLVSCAAPIVLLTHPITGFVLATGFVTFSAGVVSRAPARVAAAAAGIIAASVLGVLLWPYYPWLQLIVSGSQIYRTPNLGVYDGALQRIWPALIGLPFAVRRLSRDRFDGLGLLVAALFALYVIGWAIHNGPLGRVLSALVLGLHLCLAKPVAELETRLSAAPDRTRLRWFHAAVAVASLAGVAIAAPALVRAAPRPLLPAGIRGDPRLERMTDVYRPLRAIVGRDDVVIADVNVSRHVPAFAGKVVGFIDPEAFVADERSRREALYRFFDDKTSDDERRAILRAYHASFIAIDLRQQTLAPPTAASIARLGHVVFDNGRMRVFKVDDAGARQR